MALDAGAGRIRVAVLGGGVAGAAFVYGLRRPLTPPSPSSPSSASPSAATPSPPLDVTLFEMGRAAGGRTATRFTRDLPGLRVNHGAPHFDSVHSQRFRDILAQLHTGGYVAPFAGTCGVLHCGGAGSVEGEGATFAAAATPGEMWVGTPGMNALADGLLRLGVPDAPLAATCRFSTMIRGIEWIPGGGWRLYDKEQQSLGDFDWLAISSSGLCHPRWQTTFGGPPPMVAAAQRVDDAALHTALAKIGKVKNRPVTAVLMAFDGETAAAWAALPWSVAVVEGDADIAKVIIDRLEGGLVSVVIHSTEEFASNAADVYGAKSTAARVGGANNGAPDREAEVVAALLAALRRRLVPKLLTAEAFDRSPAWGAHLHRWGAAFPSKGGLPLADAVAPASRCVWMGDYVGDSPTGRVEDAAVSGLAAADALLSHTLRSPRL